MNQRDAFLRAIGEKLYDDVPRLMFADWLDEHGDPDSGEFIRIQCELEPMRDQYEIDRAAELHKREDELRWEHQKKWLAGMPPGWDDHQTGAAVEFRRGFVDTLSLPVRTFLDLGAEIRRLHPTIRRVVLFRVHGYGEWYADKDRIKAYLMDTIGFRPGFIRIRVCHFPGDESKYDSPSPESGSNWGVSLGEPDSDDAQWWEDNSIGIGGEIYHQIHEGEYVLGWDRYADKCARVHST